MIRLLVLVFITVTTPMFNEVRIPDNWNPEFTIRLSHSGSMSGTSTEIEYRYSECTYTYSGNSEPVTYTFKMTDAWRSEILARLRALKVDKIKPRPGTLAVNDGWSRSMCFGSACIEGGTSVEMTVEDKNTFLETFGYLQQFALDRKP